MMSNQRNVENFCQSTQVICWSQRMMSNQTNVESFCLSEAAESSLEVSAHSGQLFESNNDVEPKKCGKLLSVH